MTLGGDSGTLQPYLVTVRFPLPTQGARRGTANAINPELGIPSPLTREHPYYSSC